MGTHMVAKNCIQAAKYIVKAAGYKNIIQNPKCNHNKASGTLKMSVEETDIYIDTRPKVGNHLSNAVKKGKHTCKHGGHKDSIFGY